MKHKTLAFGLILALAAGQFFIAQPAEAQVFGTRDIIFPILGPANFSDDFGDPRDGGARKHEGNDIFGKKLQQLTAAVDGILSLVVYPEANWGYSITIEDKDDYTYHYLHMNNDSPGTDDGRGDGVNAYAIDVMRGVPVVKGQLIGYMGDSGNAETAPPHLHFEIRAPGGTPLNPYTSLKAAPRITTPTVRPELPNETLPYGEFAGGMSVAAGNVDKDRTPEVVTAAGPGGGPLVRLYDDDRKKSLKDFYAYDINFTGGVDVAMADIDDDNKDEIITAPGPGGGSYIKIFESDGTLIKEFFAYDLTFTGGVNIAAGDLDNDGEAEIVTAPASAGGPHVKVFDGNGALQEEFFAYNQNFLGGVDVAVAEKTSRRAGSIVTAPGPGGGSTIKIFDANDKMTKEFEAFAVNFNLGLRVSAGPTSASSSAKPQIVVMPASGGGPHLKTFSIAGKAGTLKLTVFEPWWRGGYDVAVAAGKIFIGSRAGRRASLRIPDSASSRRTRR